MGAKAEADKTIVAIEARRTSAVLGTVARGRALLKAVGAKHVRELAEERETERLIDFCKRNLDANAWLPKAAQTKLLAALVHERFQHSMTRDELGSALVQARRDLKKSKDEHAFTSKTLAALVERTRDRIPVIGAKQKGAR